jgi:hypothetical protein
VLNSIGSPIHPPLGALNYQVLLEYLLVEMSKWVVPVGRPVARHGFGPSRTRHGLVVDGPGPARPVSRAGLGPLPWHAVPARARPSFFILFSSAFICILKAILIV